MLFRACRSGQAQPGAEDGPSLDFRRIQSSVTHRLTHLSPSQPGSSAVLPRLRRGVVLVGQRDDAELRDSSLGQVVKLGEAAAVIVSLLDGERDAAAVLLRAGQELGSPLDPMGLVDLLQALDQRALLDTPRARAVVSQGLVRADVAVLRRISQRPKPIMQLAANTGAPPDRVRMAPGSNFACNSCTRCCTSKHLLGPVSAVEVQKILGGFKAAGQPGGARASDFIPLANNGQPPESFLLRTEDGRCTFLKDSGLCGIHDLLGVEFKPAACRLFPYQPVRTVSGWDVGLSLACPTVAQGTGPEAAAGALETVTSVAHTSSLLQVITDTVHLDAHGRVPYELYRSWEEQTVAALLDPDQTPAAAWIAGIEAFETLRAAHTSGEPDPWLAALDDDCSTVEVNAISKTATELTERGQGDLSADVGRAADILLRDLAMWLELLIGLEAADPAAIRKVRRGIVRLRSDLDVAPMSAPVLAERARLTELVADAAETLDEPHSSAGAPHTATSPAILAVQLSNAKPDTLQRRFLVQSLLGKSLFRYSNVRHGLLAITVHFGLLRLERMAGDPFAAEVDDVSYLFTHPQFTDIIDSRAVVRHHDSDASIHRSILGVSFAR